MATMNHQIVLAARPEGLPKPSDFRLVEATMPEPAEGQFLVKTNYLSVDPYMRGRISEAKSYAEPVQIGQVMVRDDDEGHQEFGAHPSTSANPIRNWPSWPR